MMPVKHRNKDVRPREYLTINEIHKIVKASLNTGRHQHRDATLILIAYRHGLRVSELVSLKWDQFNLKESCVHVNRAYKGNSSTHPLSDNEIRVLRKLQRDYPDTQYVFVTERKGPLATATVRKLVARAGVKAGLPFPIHPHMLRHSIGFYLAKAGYDTRAIQLYLGNTQIQHAVQYTENTIKHIKANVTSPIISRVRFGISWDESKYFDVTTGTIKQVNNELINRYNLKLRDVFPLLSTSPIEREFYEHWLAHYYSDDTNLVLIPEVSGFRDNFYYYKYQNKVYQFNTLPYDASGTKAINFRYDFLAVNPKENKMVLIELDGHDAHKTKPQRIIDSIKRNEAAKMGVPIIVFTGSQVYSNIASCFDLINNILTK